MAKKPARKMPLRFEWVEAGSLEDNPANWRRHPPEQVEAFRDLLEDPEIGWAGAALYNEQTKRLLDGHARKNSVDPRSLIPVLIGNWSPAAEKKILATLDTIGGMAGADKGKLTALLGGVSFASSPLQGLLSSTRLAFGVGSKKTKMTSLPTTRPPAMTWVLIGIPTVRYGEIAETMERMAGMNEVILETTVGDKREGEDGQ